MFSKVSRSTTSLFVLCTALLISNTLLAADGPWSLSDALGLDNGFTLGGEHQSRFEHYDGNVFVGTSPNDGAFFLRTTLDARYRKDGFSAQVEMMDSRQGQADRDTRLSNSHVSTLDLLQANVAYKFGANSANEIRVGRFTQD